MILALSGTPGTGKSTVAALLAARGYRTIALNDVIRDQGFSHGIDSADGALIVDMHALDAYLLNAFADTDGALFLEGHIAHALTAPERIIVLRCAPSELKKRLESRAWSAQKIAENCEAEAVDAITVESVETGKRVREIDTTKQGAGAIADIIEALLTDDDDTYAPGRIDWSGEILAWY